MTLTRASALNPKLLASILLSAVLIALAAGCIAEDDLTLEERANLLEGQLLCPVCDGQTIQESQAQIAVSMKSLLREQLMAGSTNEEVRQFFVARYGEGVLAYPEARGFGLVAWIVPVVVAVGGAAVLAMVLWDMRRSRRGGGGGSVGGGTGAEVYAARVERELQRFAARRRGGEGQG